MEVLDTTIINVALPQTKGFIARGMDAMDERAALQALNGQVSRRLRC